jgi:hypothetical protein
VEGGKIWKLVELALNSDEARNINNYFNENNVEENIGHMQILKIQKIFNCVIFKKFRTEFKRMIKKYRSTLIGFNIMKFLFHGTSNINPYLIFSSEDGIDIRFSRSGLYGNGIYFAQHSSYSHNFSF